MLACPHDAQQRHFNIMTSRSPKTTPISHPDLRGGLSRAFLSWPEASLSWSISAFKASTCSHDFKKRKNNVDFSLWASRRRRSRAFLSWSEAPLVGQSRPCSAVCIRYCSADFSLERFYFSAIFLVLFRIGRCEVYFHTMTSRR